MNNAFSIDNKISTHHYSRKAAMYYLLNLSIICLFLLFLRVYFIHLQIWPVNGDEAQYWSWGKHLAFGYYSKPPMLAWIIAFTTKLFGNGLIGLRIGSPLCHTITSYIIFFIASRLYNHKIGFWSAVVFILLPGVSFSSNIVSTDPVLLMFFALSFYFFVRALESNELHWWLLTGVALGLAMLSKYAAIFFPISAIFYFLISKEKRFYLKEYKFYLSLLIALLVLSPNIWWNIQTGFLSVIAVKNNADLGGSYFHPFNMLSFIGAQFAIFGPILFATLLRMFLQWKSISQDPREKLLLAFVIPLLLVMTIEGLLSRAHGNWAAAIYITATIAVVATIIEKRQFYWINFSLVISILAIIVIFYIKPIVRAFHIHMPARTTTLDWGRAGEKIATIKNQYPNSLLLVDSRMLLAKTMYFSKIPLSETFEWNPSLRIHDQYGLVTHLQTQKGKNFILVTYNFYPLNIWQDFQSHQFIAKLQLPTLNGDHKAVFIFYLKNFLGYNNVGGQKT